MEVLDGGEGGRLRDTFCTQLALKEDKDVRGE
jgi:hypothetical protein